MKKDNRGFTLIELLVVIAIMGILAGVVATSTSLSAAARAKSCATQITDYLARTRIGCLSRTGTSYMTIKQESNGAYVLSYYENGTFTSGKGYTGGNVVSTSTISGRGVTVSCEFDSSGFSTITASDYTQLTRLPVSFNRDGSLSSPTVANNKSLTIKVTGAGRTYTITVTPATGAITRS